VTPAHVAGSVCFLANLGVHYNCPTTLVNGAAQLQFVNLGPGNSPIGTQFVQAQFQPSGNALASQSGQLNIVFTGSQPLTICATAGSNVHCTNPITVTIQ